MHRRRKKKIKQNILLAEQIKCRALKSSVVLQANVQQGFLRALWQTGPAGCGHAGGRVGHSLRLVVVVVAAVFKKADFFFF